VDAGCPLDGLPVCGGVCIDHRPPRLPDLIQVLLEERCELEAAHQPKAAVTPAEEIPFENPAGERNGRHIPEHRLEGRRRVRLTDIEGRRARAGRASDPQWRKAGLVTHARVEHVRRARDRVEAVDNSSLSEDMLSERRQRGWRKPWSRQSSECLVGNFVPGGLQHIFRFRGQNFNGGPP